MGVYKTLYTLFLVASPLVVTHFVPQPFMDEWFHVRQTLQYVETQDFSRWDPKITTPPGLYAVAFVVCQFLNWHSLLLLRAINVVPMLLVLLFSHRGLVLTTFPLLFFYSSLYYTDVFASLLVIGAFSTKKPVKAALIAFTSLFFRQTNIVWAGVVGGFLLIPEQTTFNQLYRDAVGSRNLLAWSRITPIVIPFGLLAASFVAFLKINGGITLGDRSNHQVALHGAQLLYFLLFQTLFSLPLAVVNTFNSLSIPSFKRLVVLTLRTAAELTAIVLLIRYTTIVHPFILADNRHYTFYLWRRLITPLDNMLLVPVYFACWRWFASTLNFRYVRTWIYLAAVCLVLVPSPLMEPRYYILPYLVWRTCLYGKRGRIIEILWNTIINLTTLAVFCLSETHFMY